MGKRGKEKLLAAPQVSVDVSCPAVSEGFCSLSQVFLLFLVNTGIRMGNSVHNPLSAVFSLFSSSLEITFGLYFLYQA